MEGKKTARTRAWGFPTSPRSPYKIQGELRLLKEFDGKPWNKWAQLRFAEMLSSYEGFEGSASKSESTFSARDRLRGPRILGLICTPKRGTRNGILEFTDVGNLFLHLTDAQQELILQRQIAKVQFRSHLHRINGYKEMRIRPMMLMVKLLLELERMTKEEVALFALTTTNYQQVPDVIKTIKRFRRDLEARTPAMERKRFKEEFRKQYICEIYRDDIEEGRTKLREGGTDFVKTKIATLRDYADSTIRYLTATGIFTILPHGQNLALTRAKLKDARFLLERYGMDIAVDIDGDYYSYVKGYLGNPSLPVLRIDSTAAQYSDIEDKVVAIEKEDAQFAKTIELDFASATSSSEKLNILARADSKLTEIQVRNQALVIKNDQKSSFIDILNLYEAINDRRAEILDRPLMYEWNAWRAMVLVNDALNVQGNYHADVDGNPVSTASGNMPDILCEYDEFWLAIEVTLQRGMRQFETEGESITRHVGNLQRALAESNDKRPIFGMFIAEKIHDEVVDYLFTYAHRFSQTYKGKIRILPLERKYFQKFIASALRHPKFSNQILLSFFNDVFYRYATETGELDWIQKVNNAVSDLHVYSG